MNSASTWLASIARGGRHIALPLIGAAGLELSIGAFLPHEGFRSGTAVSIPGSDGPWPDWLFAAVIALCLSALLMLFALIARLRRKRRPANADLFEEEFEPPPVSTATGALLLVTTGLLVFIALRVLWSTQRDPAALARNSGQAVSAPVVTALPALARAVTHSALASIAVGLVALLVAAAAFTFVSWIHFGGTRLRSSSPSDRSSQTLRQAVEESIDALQSGGTPREAIIACYAGFEQALATAGLSRAPSHTATEFARNASRQFRLPVNAVRDLVHLFELARFSELPAGDRDRDAARRALDALKAALGEGADHAPTA